MIVGLVSASGSPGVTTTAIGLACSWPRHVVCVDADATGGSGFLAGFFRGFHVPSATLIDLLLSHRAGNLAQDIDRACLPLSETALALPGPRSHRQVRSVGELWEPLITELFVREDCDVIVDLGRLGAQSFPSVIMERADVVALLVRSHLPSVAAARQWGAELVEWKEQHPEVGAVGVIVIGDNRPYSTHEVSTTLGLPSLWTLGWDPRSAETYSMGVARKPSRKYIRQLRSCGQALREAGEERSSRDGRARGFGALGASGASCEPESEVMV